MERLVKYVKESIMNKKKMMLFLSMILFWFVLFIISYMVGGMFYDFMLNANIWFIMGMVIVGVLINKKSS